MINLAKRAVLGFAQLITVLGILLLAPASTLGYWQAWLYLFFFAGSSALITAYLWKKDPRLLERRLNAGPGAEKRRIQKLLQIFASLLFIGAMILPSLDHRLSWSAVPLPVVFVGDAMVVLGFLIVFLVFRENPFTAASIEVAPDDVHHSVASSRRGAATCSKSPGLRGVLSESSISVGAVCLVEGWHQDLVMRRWGSTLALLVLICRRRRIEPASMQLED